MKNTIYLRRKNKIIIDNDSRLSWITASNQPYIATILKNLESLGYTLSSDIINSFNFLSTDELKNFYFSLVKDLKVMLGAHIRYQPMYPNFPQQVMDADISELFINAIIHYWSFGELLPIYEKKERIPLIDIKKLKVINLGNEEDFLSIFKNLLQSKTSLSDIDKQDIEWFFMTYRDNIKKILPDEIPLKENVALIANLILKYTPYHKNILFKYFKTATDVLRLLVSMSNGDISLSTNTKFRSFKRSERRLILSLLENCSNIEEDMVKYKYVWIRVGERLHPAEYKDYPKVNLIFKKLRDNKKIYTFNSKVHQAISKNDLIFTLKLLKQRPGEFARKLDYVLRNNLDTDMIVADFDKIAKNVSTPILLQVSEHFKNRNNYKELRTFFPKGNVAKVYGLENNLNNIDSNVCEAVVNICDNALLEIFKSRDQLGKVYIDQKLNNYLVPFSQRSASKALKTIVRGSKIDIPETCNTIRSFIYWKQPKNNRVDLDLSAVMYDKNWYYKEHISYTNLRSNRYKAYHSGDIISAPNGASEFIDLDLNSIRKYGGRYVIFNILSYTGTPFIELPECFAGWMSREYPDSGEIYEPKVVENKFDVTANTKICIPMILDLEDNRVIWTDVALKKNPNWCNNIENNQRGIVLIGKALTTLVKPNLYDLFNLHARARGEICDNIDEADTIFSLDKGITPFDTDIIISQYL